MKKFFCFLPLVLLFFSLTACNTSQDNSGLINEESTTHEHTYSSSWKYDNTYHWHNSTCGHSVINDKETHTFNSVVTDPTYASEGYTTHTCTVCGYSYKDSETGKLSITITWRNYDGSVLEIDTDVPYGSIPHYDGIEPSKKGDAHNVYVFSGWSPKLTSATCSGEYVATFKSDTFDNLSSKTLTISRTKNKPTDLSAFNAVSSNNKTIHFSGSQLSPFTNGVFTIADTGYMLNNNSIDGIESISVVFSGSLSIQYGWLVNGKIHYSILDESVISAHYII